MRIENPQDLGNRARDQRRRLGWTQAELARRIGSTRFWVSDLEAGKPTLELALVLKALRALGLMLDVRAPDAAATPQAGEHPTLPRIDIDRIVDGTGEEP
mgnify:CR=1 FL=1